MVIPARIVRRFDRKRLRRLLIVFFLLLVIPTAALIWQAYGQLKWESFYQHRISAELLTRRIDGRLVEQLNAANARSFADYTFLVVSGEPSASFVQPSQLSSNPPVQDIPGTIGYFQVDADGTFSTPLLPPNGTDAARFGINETDLQSRLMLADQIQSTLARNRLVSSRTAPAPQALGVAAAANLAGIEDNREGSDNNRNPQEERASMPSRARNLPETLEETSDYDQAVFDRLGQSTEFLAAPRANNEDDASRQSRDLGLDERYDLKSEAESAERSARLPADSGRKKAAKATPRRKEQTALPETGAREPTPRASGVPGKARILTFESEVDPLEVRLLDDGHLVAYRKVWRESERIIQGMLIDAKEFYDASIRSAYADSSLPGIAALAIAYEGRLLSSDAAAREERYDGGELKGSLLYRSRLSTPLAGMELIFSIDRLPPGPGARVLGWVSFILVLVIAGGFAAMYRLGLGQIALARQQQDFVSAVSHELKTPLTSIRMYGEMLKEGWADADKRQSYYEFIHDESERLTRLIANVLQLARISRNDTHFDLKPIEAGKLMDQIDSKLGNQIARAGFSLEVERNADDAVVQIDEDSFMQIMINLVDNALKFSASSDRKTLRISCRRSAGNSVQFAVRDFGPGIEKGQLRKIFTMFYRPESELTRSSVGTGIGLAIVQQLTQAMGGRVDVSNEHPGARFSVTFPAI